MQTGLWSRLSIWRKLVGAGNWVDNLSFNFVLSIEWN